MMIYPFFKKVNPVVICAYLLIVCAPARSQDASFERFTNELIWYSGEFQSERVGGIRSMDDGKHYTSLENSQRGSTIVKYAYKTGKAVDTLATSESVFGDPNQYFDNYEFSSKEQSILISTETESIYRHSFSANFYTHNLVDGQTQPLSDFSKGKQRLASFSPNADQVAFMRNNNVFIADINVGSEVQVTTDGQVNEIINGATDWVYEEEFGDDNGLFWSPDGKYLAFYQFDEKAVREFSMPMYGQLYPEPYVFKYPKAGEVNAKASVFVHDVEGDRNIPVVLPKTEYIPRIKWGVDNTQLVVMTMNRHQNVLNLMMANCENIENNALTARSIWEEESATYIDLNDDIRFLKDGTSFVMTSERDGFNHLYLFSTTESERTTQLTRGKWDVLEVYGVDERREQVYFTTSKKGATQTHIARVSFDGKMEIIDEESGTHSASYSNSFDYSIHVQNDANTPPVYSLRDRKGKVVRSLKENEGLREKMKDYNVQPKTFFTFENRLGDDLNAWMIKPPGFEENIEYPVYVAIYGGPGVNTVEDAWGGATYYWHQMLAQQGYIVVSCDPRGTPKRGKSFKHSTYKELGKLETEDFIDFGKYLQDLSFVDSGRIGMQGWSYGGFMTLLCMTKGADVFAAGISVAPVTNWRYYDTIYTERFMQTPEENASGYDENSPVNHAEKLSGPLLLVHGSADDNVHYQNSMEMVNALVSANKQFDFFAYPDRNHGIYGGKTRLHLFNMMMDFVQENF
jgi:dipeptidyl-peptidase-4